MTTTQDILEAIIDENNVELLTLVSDKLYNLAAIKLEERKKEIGAGLFTESGDVGYGKNKVYGLSDPQENQARIARDTHNQQLDQLHLAARKTVANRGGSVITDRIKKQNATYDRNQKNRQSTPEDRSDNAHRIANKLNKIGGSDTPQAQDRMDKLNQLTWKFQQKQRDAGQESTTKLTSRNMTSPVADKQDEVNNKKSKLDLRQPK
jgi:hypothetical protein